MIHQDLETTEHISIDVCVELATCPRLRLLQLFYSSDVSTLLRQLTYDSTLCSNLELVEVRCIQGMESSLPVALAGKLDQANALRSSKIRFMFVSELTTELPNAFKEYKCEPDNLCTDYE